MTMRRLMGIVPVANRVTATEALIARLEQRAPDGDAASRVRAGWENIFSVALSPTGAEPATHYAFNAQVPTWVFTALQPLGANNNAHGLVLARGTAYGIDKESDELKPGDPAAGPVAERRESFERVIGREGLQFVVFSSVHPSQGGG